MLNRESYEEREKVILAPYAQLSSQSLGRQHAEEECTFRSRFQRDRDRIIHSSAFRRLEHKTQVFVTHEGDYYRTRLTHTLEVGQISRGLSRILKVNEDLAETIAYCHDLGHTPFGHAGEEVMNKLMEGHGGFEHNTQSFRVVSFLEERYPNFPGLNLTYEVLEGIMKHTTEYDHPNQDCLKKPENPTVEAQIVNFADEIAYMNHDLDDGLQSKMLDLKDLRNVPLWQATYEEATRTIEEGVWEKIKRYRTISRLIHKLVVDLQQETRCRLEKYSIKNLEDVRSCKSPIVGFSPEMESKTKELKKFLYENMYFHWRVERMAQKARRVLRDLFQAYTSNPKILPKGIVRKIDKEGDIHRTACDYIAGMTDRFALQEHKRLFDPQERV